jgi:hypothetical protein
MASADKQAARNRQILIAKVRGEDTKVLAERYEISPSRVRQILAAGTAVLADGGPDPVQVALEHRAQYEVIYEKALAMFERIPDSNPAPKVGALRLTLLALDRLSTWDQTIGVLPQSLSTAFQQIDYRRFFNEFFDALDPALEAAGFSQEKVDQIVEASIAHAAKGT